TCIAGALGIPGSTPQRTPRRNCYAGLFLGFAITSAVFGGIIIIAYSTIISLASYEDYIVMERCTEFQKMDEREPLVVPTLGTRTSDYFYCRLRTRWNNDLIHLEGNLSASLDGENDATEI
ncbi:hypothetical protein P5673_030684, partial [Acropora cervicornis]